MSATANGEVSLYYETFGADDDPVLLLVNGLGSQCINFKAEFCEKFAGRGFRVVRFDNRDVGLSSHLKGGPHYTVDDMAQDGFAVLDAVGADAAHRPAGDVGDIRAGRVEHGKAVLGHVVDRVVRSALQVAGQPDVPVVEAHDPESAVGELLAELGLEVDALAAEAVDQQQHRVVIGAEGLVVQRHLAVRGGGHTAVLHARSRGGRLKSRSTQPLTKPDYHLLPSVLQ